MKKYWIPLVMLLTVSLCLPMNGCSLYRIEKGYGYFTELPPMFIGIQTNQVEYPLEVRAKYCGMLDNENFGQIWGLNYLVFHRCYDILGN